MILQFHAIVQYQLTFISGKKHKKKEQESNKNHEID